LSGVTVAAYESCVSDIKTLAASGATLWVDPEKVSCALVTAAEEAAAEAQAQEQPKKKAKGTEMKKTILEGVSPIPLAKGIKNQAELDGMMEAHLRDGVAMASFWCWLDEQVAAGVTHDEYEIGEVVRQFRQKQTGFSEESFATIAGEGPHGAIIHYRATKESARTVGSDSLLLCDSGGQYECGTTDTTRTHHTGIPTAFQKQAYTRVLLGHIALASARFPTDTSGFVLDVFARSHLWQNGLDYRHGTGHGVGAALNGAYFPIKRFMRELYLPYCHKSSIHHETLTPFPFLSKQSTKARIRSPPGSATRRPCNPGWWFQTNPGTTKTAVLGFASRTSWSSARRLPSTPSVISST